MASLLSQETTPPGDDSLAMSEDRLLSFLRRKIAGEALPVAVAAHFHDTDIYIVEPSLLSTLFDPAPGKKGESGSWFFFTRVKPKSSSDSRKSRQVAGGVGTWHSERAPRRVLDGEGNCAGHSQYFCYKLKTGKNCSERTEWYMVEFSQDQEADHDRVHGGEPQLVLCKIYKAHTHSRSGSGSASRSSCSASARKRKAVDEASAPVKAKRRLFDSPALSLQEQVCSKGWIASEAAASQGKQVSSKGWIVGEAATSQSQEEIGDTLDWMASMSKANGEAATAQGKMSSLSDWFPLMSKEDGEVATWTSQGKSVDTSSCTALMSKADGEEATLQGKMSGISDWFPFMSGDGEVAISTSQGNMSAISDWFPFMSKADGEVAASTSQGSIGDTSNCIALMSKADGKAATSQLKIGDTSDFARFWPEPEATWGYSMTGGALPTLDWGYSMTGGALPTLDRGYSMTGGALPTLENCSRAIVRDVGDLFCWRDAGSSSFCTSDHTTAFVHGMPSAPVLQQGEASWWSGTGINGVWSC